MGVSVAGGRLVGVGMAVIDGEIATVKVGDGVSVAEPVAVACNVAQVTVTGVPSGWQLVRKKTRYTVNKKSVQVRWIGVNCMPFII